MVFNEAGTINAIVVDGSFWTVERFDDSELWEVESIQSNLPDSVDLEIKVIVGGVTLDDYTLERWITNADYDETGIYCFRLFHSNDESASVCHSFCAYQRGQLIWKNSGTESLLSKIEFESHFGRVVS